VYVTPERQRQGVARYLLSEALRRSPEFSLSTLLGFIFGHNLPSLRLFEGFGFERWALLPRIAELDGVERDLIIVGKRVDQ
jgi:phosphinothricin acetyltransferase